MEQHRGKNRGFSLAYFDLLSEFKCVWTNTFSLDKKDISSGHG